jgi:hypothetical protein
MEWLFSEAWWFPERRLDFLGLGPGSENRTGALLAQLVVSAWWFSLVWRRWGWGLSLILSSAAMVLLLQTQSRGALFGVFVGGMVLLYQSSVGKSRCFPGFGKQRKSCCEADGSSRNMWRFLPLMVCILAAGVLSVYAYQLGVGGRIQHAISGEDGSTEVRLDIYQAGLRMLVDGPLGWENPADAYSQWYQDLGNNRWYLSLLNSHLTWMNQYGWWFSLPYIAAWLAVLLFLLGGPSLSRPFSRMVAGTRGTALAVWMVLGGTACFSHVLSWWGMWIIPGVWLLAVVVLYLFGKDGAVPFAWRWVVWGTVVIALILGLSGWILGRGKLDMDACRERITLRGSGVPHVVVLGVDRQVIGDRYGHTLREWLDELGRVDICTASRYRGEPSDTLVIAGSALPKEITSLPDAKNVLLLNPDFREDWAALLQGRQVRIIFGGLGDWRRRQAWEPLVGQHPEWQVIRLGWAGNFIPDWPRYITPDALGSDDEVDAEEDAIWR